MDILQSMGDLAKLIYIKIIIHHNYSEIILIIIYKQKVIFINNDSKIYNIEIQCNLIK